MASGGITMHDTIYNALLSAAVKRSVRFSIDSDHDALFIKTRGAVVVKFLSGWVGGRTA
jgi:hypothetical protein